MTPTLAYLLGLVTLPGMVLGIGAAFYVCDRVVGWWRGPVKRWQMWARESGRMIARTRSVHGDARNAHLDALAFGQRWSRRWARWAPWWPA